MEILEDSDIGEMNDLDMHKEIAEILGLEYEEFTDYHDGGVFIVVGEEPFEPIYDGNQLLGLIEDLVSKIEQTESKILVNLKSGFKCQFKIDYELSKSVCAAIILGNRNRT